MTGNASSAKPSAMSNAGVKSLPSGTDRLSSVKTMATATSTTQIAHDAHAR